MSNVPLDKQDQKRVGEILSGYIQSGRDVKGDIRQWWEECEAVHRNEIRGNAGTSEDPGYEIFHLPLSQPRQDALSAQVCAVITQQEPIMLDTSDDDRIADAKQRIVDRIWNDAGFDKRMRTCCPIVTDTDIAYARVCPLGDGQIEISIHHPLDVIVFPALPTGMFDVTIMGHRVFKRRRDIEALRRDKVYYDTDHDLPESSPGTDEYHDPALDRSGVTDTSSPLPELDALVELWDVVVYLGLDKIKALKEDELSKKEGWYRATVCPDINEVLALEPYPYSRPWYFAFRLKGSARYYPATSVGRDLLPIQRAYNNLQSAFYASTMMGIAAPIFGPKLNDAEKYSTYGTFQYVETDSPVQPWAPNVRPMTAPIPLMLQNYERLADQVARISQNTTGGAAPDQTATEASIVASGVAVGIEEYIANFTAELPDMAAFTMEIVAGNPLGFSQRFNIVEPGMPDTGSGMSPIEIPFAELGVPSIWATNGQSPANSPQAMIQFAQTILPLAMDPNMAQVSGLQIYELVRVLIANSPLKNAKGVQISQEELYARLAPNPNGLGQPGQMVGSPGGEAVPPMAGPDVGGGGPNPISPTGQ